MDPGTRRISPFAVAVTLLGVFLLYLVVPGLGQVVAAARPGAGEPGTFTAERLECIEHPGHRSCDWYGTFRPRTGAARPEIGLYGGEGAVRAGDAVPARDVGRPAKVYRHAGSREWVFSALLALGGLFVLQKGARSLLVKRPLRQEGTAGTAAS